MATACPPPETLKDYACVGDPMKRLGLLALLFLIPGVTAFDSGDIEPEGTWSMTFDEENPSGYMYHCHPHPFMTGMVHVMADSDGEVTTHNVDIVEGEKQDDWGYRVEHLEIEVGDTVVWTNRGEFVHTVTEMSGDMDHEHGDHDHGTDDQDSPLPFAFAAVALAIAFLARRR